MPLDDAPAALTLLGPVEGRAAEVLTPEALDFVARLHRRFDGRRRELLAARQARQARFDAGELPGLRADTAAVRAGDWRIAPVPPDLLDRRVEITGPVDRKMVINALNSGAKVFMADFEDATSPTWSNLVSGQLNLMDRWRGALSHVDPLTGKTYAVGATPAVLMVRPRGWHLLERHLEVDGRPVAGALFDFGLYAFHNAQAAADAGSGAYFYLPKLESAEEAALWDDVFTHAEQALGAAHGAFKATVLIETLPAAFEMDEILHALRDHVVGLNCGRWDYIFSFIKTFRADAARLTPDRGAMRMGEAFLGAYSLRLIQTCHRRGAFAMGGMAAQIPIKGDAAANAAAVAKVRADKEREAREGHDGCWVAHPDLVPVALEAFERVAGGANQLARLREDVRVETADLLHLHAGPRTEAGVRENIRIGVRYLQAWLEGRGAVPLYGLMEDAATAEICRTQLWQWLRYGAPIDGAPLTSERFSAILAEETVALAAAYGSDETARALELFTDLVLAPDLADFLTLPAYAALSAADARRPASNGASPPIDLSAGPG